MGASLTPVVWTLRTGELHDRYGDPYDAVATVTRMPDDTAYVSGAVTRDGVILRHMRKAVLAALKDAGFKRVEFERIDGRKLSVNL